MIKILPLFYLIITIIIGIISRVIPFHNIILNKYIGDSLYAIALFYFLILIFNYSRKKSLIATVFLVSFIELFQITHIPLYLANHNNMILRIVAIFIGTNFSIYDLLAYYIGLIIIYYFHKYVKLT